MQLAHVKNAVDFFRVFPTVFSFLAAEGFV
jgi:hypothetical protein